MRTTSKEFKLRVQNHIIAKDTIDEDVMGWTEPNNKPAY